MWDEAIISSTGAKGLSQEYGMRFDHLDFTNRPASNLDFIVSNGILNPNPLSSWIQVDLFSQNFKMKIYFEPGVTVPDLLNPYSTVQIPRFSYLHQLPTPPSPPNNLYHNRSFQRWISQRHLSHCPRPRSILIFRSASLKDHYLINLTLI